MKTIKSEITGSPPVLEVEQENTNETKRISIRIVPDYPQGEKTLQCALLHTVTIDKDAGKVKTVFSTFCFNRDSAEQLRDILNKELS